MRHWIAAGFIREKENKTLEDVADGYLTELVNRSLLQVVERNHAGRLRYCRMHDVIRLLALNKATEECFGKVYDGSGVFSVDQGTRRISIQSDNLEQLSRSGVTHFREIHVFESSINMVLLKPVITSSNLLSTLDLQGGHIKMLPNEIFNLFNLRYLGLRDTGMQSLPEAIGKLRNLQVLDAFNTKLSYLPNNVVKLHKLRYLYAGTACLEEIKQSSGVKVPNGIRHLTALQALQSVKASSEILCEVGALTQLRTFDVSDVKSKHTADLSNAITKMCHLVHLQIAAAGEEEVLQLEELHLPPTLSTLGLEGQLEKASVPQALTSWSHLKRLTWLFLTFSKVDEESFSSLLVLRGLCFLQLNKAFEGKKLHFDAGSFPKLRHLFIWDTQQLSQVEIEEGAMQSLMVLRFCDCPELKFLPHGIEHLTGLEELRLEETSEELVQNLRQEREANECSEDLRKIRHIRKVIVELTKEGIWKRIR